MSWHFTRSGCRRVLNIDGLNQCLALQQLSIRCRNSDILALFASAAIAMLRIAEKGSFDVDASMPSSTTAVSVREHEQHTYPNPLLLRAWTISACLNVQTPTSSSKYPKDMHHCTLAKCPCLGSNPAQN
jgi:hypothetical protein